jgi:hypothetical protein
MFFSNAKISAPLYSGVQEKFVGISKLKAKG